MAMKSRVHEYENWIFDWSGTLVDDLTMVLDATNHVLRQYRKEAIDLSYFRRHFRLPYAGFYDHILPGVPLTELEDHFRDGFSNSAASGVESPLLPNALDFLECLQSRRKRMFILTSMDAKDFAGHVTELGVDHFFEATYAGVLDKREVIHAILRRHELETHRTVYLGDMCHDVETARHGEVASIALLTGYQSRIQLSRSAPDWLADNLADVQRELEYGSCS